MRATLFVLQTLHFAFSQRVEIVDTPSHIYFGMGQALDFWVLVEEDAGARPLPASAAGRGLLIELWIAWDRDEPYLGVRTDAYVSLPFKEKFSVSINTPGSLQLRAVLKPADSAEGTFDDEGIARSQHRLDITELQMPLFTRAHKDAKVRLLDGQEAQEFASAAVKMYSSTEHISVQRVVHAFSIDMTTPACTHEASVLSCSQRVWITIECARDQASCAAGGFFAFGIDKVADSRGLEHLTLYAARGVPTQVWAGGAPQYLPRLVEQGVCSAKEPLVEHSLLPWRRFGAKVRERDVNKVLVLADKLCTQRVQIIDNALFVSEPHYDALPPRVLAKGQERERWYTIALVETLLAVLQQVRVPDVDVCVRDELPQILKGENVPALASTISDAHMDILAPDLFFRYWSPETEQDEDTNHPFYKPPRDWSVAAASAAPPWDSGAWARRIPKVWWRGTIESWHMSSRGLLVKLSRQFPDLIDALPLRLVGDALEEEWEGLDEIKHMAQSTRGSSPAGSSAQRSLAAGSILDGHEQFRFRYLICTHGNGNEWVGHRLRSQLSTGALVFRQDSSLREMWEFDLEPFTHYIPVAADLSDLVEKIEWAIEHDDEAQAIAQRGFAFVRESLRPQRIVCYWAHLLTGFGELMDFRPQPASNASRYINVAARLGE